RQHQYAEAALLDRVPGERHRIRQRATPGAWHQHTGRDAAVDQPFEQLPALAGVERIRLAGRAEDSQAVGAFGEQPAAMRGKALAIDGKIRLKGCQRGNEHAAREMIEADESAPGAIASTLRTRPPAGVVAGACDYKRLWSAASRRRRGDGNSVQGRRSVPIEAPAGIGTGRFRLPRRCAGHRMTCSSQESPSMRLLPIVLVACTAAVSLLSPAAGAFTCYML